MRRAPVTIYWLASIFSSIFAGNIPKNIQTCNDTLTSPDSGHKIFCHSLPKNCDLQSDPSCTIVLWTDDTAKDDFQTPSLNIKIQHRLSNAETFMEAEGYAGVAFAESNKMLDGDVYICQKSSKFGQFPVLKTHWIHDRAYPFLTANLDQIESYLNDYRYFLDGKNQSGKDSYARIISCGFRRPLELEDLGQFKFSKYNLLQSDFYMLIAHGAMETNPAKKRDIGYHSGDKNMRSSSSDKIWFTPDGKPSPEYLLRIADKNETWHQVIDNRDAKIRNLLLSHGILMIIAWLFLINLNKFIVRNCQKLGCQFFDQNKKNVYYFHVGVNILAIILVTLAVILSFAGSNWKFIGTSSESTYASVHGIVGIVILAAVYFQMILGFLKKLPLKMALQPKAEVVTQKSNYSPMSKMDEQVTQDSQISGEEVTQLGEANQENFEAQKTPKKNSSRPTGKMGTSLNLKVFNVIKLVHAVFGHSVSILAGLNVILGLFLFQNRVSWVFVLTACFIGIEFMTCLILPKLRLDKHAFTLVWIIFVTVICLLVILATIFV